MTYLEAPTEAANRYTSQELIGACYERDCWKVLFDEGSLPPDFFDLRSGLAGDLVQKLVNYRVRAGIVLADLKIYSGAFRDFVRESNQSGQARFFPNRRDAIAWLAEPWIGDCTAPPVNCTRRTERKRSQTERNKHAE